MGRTTTEDHLGPGSYYTTKNDNKRGNWTPRSPERNARPQSASFRSRELNHSLTAGILVDDLYVHQPSSNVDLPGPGYYTPRERSAGRGFSMNSSVEMAKARKGVSLHSPMSPRFTPNSAQMRDDVLCYSTGHRDELITGGPGYYYKNDCGLLKKSFNVRANRRQPLKSPQSLSPGARTPKGGASTTNFRSSNFPMSPIQKQQASYVTPVHR
jgi:hypothetical protein